MQNPTNEQEKQGLIEQLFKIGAHFGFSRSRRHPSTSPFVFGYKNQTAVIDLEKTIDLLNVAESFVEKIAAEGKAVLFVGNKSEARKVVADIADKRNLPYVAERWIGGTFTNFKQIRDRITRLLELKKQDEAGVLASRYTKKERGVIAKEVSDLERFFASLVPMEKLPGAIFVVDAKEEAIAVYEANKAGVPVIALCSSDCDIRTVQYPIIGNDANRESIKFFATRIAEAYDRGRMAASAAAAAAATATA
ncbi:MAG TPA: 30S ribosomal protein S2 [Candidatus Paceibacterota bacterium]|nr:30S ribosomal protein S2 [Candidatus Paceibacterota bacterium]